MDLRRLLVALALVVPLLGVPLVAAPTAPAGASPAAPLAAAPAPPPASASAGAASTGSYLATVYRFQGGKETQRLVLVDSTGTSSTVLERGVSKRFAGFTLLDWSSDGRTALFTGVDDDGTWVERVDVATGAVVQRLRVRRLATAVLDPSGTGILATTFESRTSGTLRLDRIAWTGARTRIPVSTNGTLLARADGTLLTAGARGRRQLLLSLADGSVLGSFPIGRAYCAPLRWWDQTRVLETCGNDKLDLVLVDPTTGATQRLSDAHGRNDYGHYDGRQLGSSVYVEVTGRCTTYVGRLEADGSTRRIRTPGSRAQAFLIDAVGSNLVLERAPACNGADERYALTLFDPVTRVETPLVRFGRNDGLGDVLVLGETRAITY